MSLQGFKKNPETLAFCILKMGITQRQPADRVRRLVRTANVFFVPPIRGYSGRLWMLIQSFPALRENILRAVVCQVISISV